MTMTTSIRRYNNISHDSHKLYYVKLGHDEIETVVTHDPRMVEAWINNTLIANNCRLDRLIVGLDIEWSPPEPQFYCDWDETDEDETIVATLQLSVGKTCLIYQLQHSEKIPDALREFLLEVPDSPNPGFTFVGVGIDEDVEKLSRDYDLMVSNTRDLRSWAADELGRNELKQAGLKKLVKEVIGEDVDKPKHVTLSDWDYYDLTEEQVVYACLDAYMSFELGRRLSAWY